MEQRVNLGMFTAVMLALGTGGLAWGEVSLEEIQADWRNREQEIRSAEFEWQLSVTRRKGTLPNVPKEKGDIRYIDPHVRFVLDGPKMRYEHSIVNKEDLSIGNATYTSIFDGKVAAEVTQYSDTNRYHIGLVEPVYDDLNSAQLLPILLWCRASALEGLNLHEFQLSPERVVVEGRDCVALRSNSTGGQGATIVLWVDPKRKSVPMRWAVEVRDSVDVEVVIKYESTGGNERVPVSWSVRNFGLPSGDWISAEEADIQKHSINERIPERTFSLRDSFPVGTVALDRLTGTKYLALRGGKKRIITKEEENIGYTLAELLATDSGELARQGPRRNRTWLIWLVGVAICAAVLVMIKRSRR